MKKLFLMMASALLLLIAGCSKEFDDSALNNRIDSLEKRMSALETVMRAYENNLFIKSVQQVDNGYVITFSDGSTATIANGKDGKDGVDGKDGLDGDTLIDYIVIGENEVTFVLTDGRKFSIALYAALSIEFDENDLVVMTPNSTHEIHYTVKSLIPDVEIEVVSSADIKAKVVATSATTGAIEVKTGAVIDEYSKIVVFVSNGERVIMRRFAFEETGLQVEDNATKEAAAEGGELVLEFLSNVECEVVIPESAQSWISVVPDTRAMEKRSITLKLEPNEGVVARKATVLVKSVDGNLSIEYTIEQGPNKDAQLALEREALIAIYKALDGDNWKDIWNDDIINKNWCSSQPLNQWNGVGTDAQGHVIYINLGGGSLSGELPSEIGNLTELKDLFLHSNNIRGEIPEEIYSLNKLERLALDNNHLTGEISPAVGNLENLQELSLARNFLTGAIPASLENLKHLQRINLRGNRLSGDIPESFYDWDFWRNCWGDCIEDNIYYFYDLNLPGPQAVVTCLDGTVKDLKAVYGENKYTILFQWLSVDEATWYMLPQLKDIYDKYANRGVEIIGWANSNGDSKESALEFIENNKMPWKNFFYNYSDFNHTHNYDHLENTFGTMAWYPSKWCTTVTIVDKNGKIVFSDMFDRNAYRSADYLINLIDRDFYYDSDYYKSTDYSQDGKVVTLQKAAKGNGIDVVLMGDAYSDRQIADGTYMKAMQTMADNLFSEEPYKSFKELFNVYVVNVVSETEDYEHGNTALSGYFGGGALVGGNDNMVFNYAFNAISAKEMDEALIIVAMNEDAYAGTCYMYHPSYATGTYGSGPSVAYFPTSSDAVTLSGLVLHEAGGHGFSKLADEYDYGTTISAEEVATYKEAQNNWGWWKNVDFTNNPAEIRWSYFLNDSRYANDGLGAFEGGLTHSFGVWRPTDNSIMRYNTGGFNAPSREAIYYRIHKLAYGDSWEYNYEDFVKYDEINRKAAVTARVYVPLVYRPTHPPVVVNKSWRDAK